MGTENRTVSLQGWPIHHDAAAGVYTHPSYTDMNAWQDRGIRAMLMDQTTMPNTWDGALYTYCQHTVIADGASQKVELRNPHPKGSATNMEIGFLDARYRIMRIKIWTEDTDAELPQQASYDANTFVNSPIPRLWYTGAGATAGDPPTGDYLEPWGALTDAYLYADASDGQLTFEQHTGGDLVFSMTAWVFQQELP
jgi:hypothetical protein